MREFLHYCPCCTKPVFSDECLGESGIYGSDGVSDLCEKCWMIEESIFDLDGTNDQPELLATYRANDRMLNRA